MSVLSSDYKRLENLQVGNEGLVDEYKARFENGDISGAQGLIDNTNNQLVIKASSLIDLVDTINYMQAFWANNKEEFAEWFFNMSLTASTYNSSNTYDIGEIVLYNSFPYICISMDTTGTWDATKWLLISNDGIGLNFKGEYDSDVSYATNDLTILVDNGSYIWQYYNGSSWVELGRTNPNIRYLEDSADAYTGEIYITPMEGGGE